MRVFAVLFSILLLPSVAFSQSIELRKLKRVGVEKVDRDTFIVEYRLRVYNNTAERISGLRASVSTDRDDIEILNPELLVGNVKAFRRKKSKETLLIKVHAEDRHYHHDDYEDDWHDEEEYEDDWHDEDDYEDDWYDDDDHDDDYDEERENHGDHEHWDDDEDEDRAERRVGKKKRLKVRLNPDDLVITFDDGSVAGLDLNADGIRDDLESISIVDYGGVEEFDYILDDVLRNRQQRSTQELSDTALLQSYRDDFRSVLCLRSVGVDVYAMLDEIGYREITNDQRRERNQAVREKFATLPSIFENGFDEFDVIAENCAAGITELP